MPRDLNSAWSWLDKLVRRVSRLESGALLENSSITNGRMRFIGGLLLVDSGGQVRVVGTLDVNGTVTATGDFNVDGPWDLAGPGTISGNTTGTGNLVWNGPWRLNGAGRIVGNVDIDGNLALANGRFTAGPLVIDRNGSYGGRVASSSTLLLDAATAVVLGAPTSVQGGLTAVGLVTGTGISSLSGISALGDLNVLGAKNFRMPHPTKPGLWLRHGSTESPVSGIEYWGDDTIGSNGTKRVKLPEYFEKLAKPGNRTVFVTGRGHSPDWSDIDNSSFTVTGAPGGRFSWLVKAERFGGDFLLEEVIPEEEVI